MSTKRTCPTIWHGSPIPSPSLSNGKLLHQLTFLSMARFFDKVLGDKVERSIPRKTDYMMVAKALELFLDAYKDREVGEDELNQFREELARSDNVLDTEKRLLNLAITDVNTFSQLIESSKSYARGSSQQYERS